DAISKLQQAAGAEATLVALCDPACAWGAVFPFEISRLPSNFVIMRQGQVMLSLEGHAQRLRTWDPDSRKFLPLLYSLKGALEIRAVDGRPVAESELLQPLLAEGFERDGKLLRRSPLSHKPLDAVR